MDLAACAAAGVTLYAPYHENDFSAAQRAQCPPPQLPKSAFTWREEQQTYQCPQGHLLHKESQERKKRADGQKLLVATYRCPGEHCQACPLRQQCAKLPAAGRTVQRSEFEGLVEALQQRMQTPAAKALYRRRGSTVELGFADVKEHRGLRTFSGRGLSRARGETGLLVLVHNLLAVDNALEKKKPAPLVENPEKIAC